MTRVASTLLIRKRDGREVEFDASRIRHALYRAFEAELGTPQHEEPASRFAASIDPILEDVAAAIAVKSENGAISVEYIQDLVETELMKRQHFRVARRYILYRTEHQRIRLLRNQESVLPDLQETAQPVARIDVVLEDDVHVAYKPERIRSFLNAYCEVDARLRGIVDIEELVDDVSKGIFSGITPKEISRAVVLAARARMERDPAYDRLAAQLCLGIAYQESIGVRQHQKQFEQRYQSQFEHYIIDGIAAQRLSGDLRRFDLQKLSRAIDPAQDDRFDYLGAQTIYDRYLIRIGDRRAEAPQYFWMRVAMGLALAESSDWDDRAIEFYRLLSSFRFTSATPTLFNSGTCHPQLSSCYLTSVQDDLEHIFKSISDNAMLSKWAGGLGNDWTNVRATGSLIKKTNGTSQGVIPFLKVVNDTAVAVNQGGKRKGAVCAYLEPWHFDFEEFIDLRKNTGDDRRRTHDMHTAAWIPDLFMQRVRDNEDWTMFSPDEVPDLHDTYGAAFKARYEHYEAEAQRGNINIHRSVSARELWRKMLTRLFETGHPWVTFKDPSNIRSPQDHVGVVHSSNLCTEILLNTSRDETAVCNLGSINLGNHIVDGRLDLELLRQSVTTAMRMLDNVIDINYYPTPEARNANLRHRPVGLGLMGYQDALTKLRIPFASDSAVRFADESMEAISYFAILASTDLARQRGKYSSYAGSKWDRGLLPIDTMALLESERGEVIDVAASSTLDWNVVREAVVVHGMRNSNCLAIAPTATISTIVGVSQSIAPTYKHLYVKSNLSGDFTQVNTVLVERLKEIGAWDNHLLDELKYHDGVLQSIERVPSEIRELFATSFEIDPIWILRAAAARQKWIDQGQSLNLYMARPSGKSIETMYQQAWSLGLKTTYYLRCLAATQVEKSTLDINRFGIQPKWMKSQSSSQGIRVDRESEDDSISEMKACRIDNPDCEACQ
jgi:ribonucleoside-diphosphate reductase alpha chain